MSMSIDRKEDLLKSRILYNVSFLYLIHLFFIVNIFDFVLRDRK